ncbi:hypothetical protein [Devosia sp. CAU 1758]
MDEATIIYGARPLEVFSRVILPPFWPVTVTNAGLLDPNRALLFDTNDRAIPATAA